MSRRRYDYDYDYDYDCDYDYEEEGTTSSPSPPAPPAPPSGGGGGGVGGVGGNATATARSTADCDRCTAFLAEAFLGGVARRRLLRGFSSPSSSSPSPSSPLSQRENDGAGVGLGAGADGRVRSLLEAMGATARLATRSEEIEDGATVKVSIPNDGRRRTGTTTTTTTMPTATTKTTTKTTTRTTKENATATTTATITTTTKTGARRQQRTLEVEPATKAAASSGDDEDRQGVGRRLTALIDSAAAAAAAAGGARPPNPVSNLATSALPRDPSLDDPSPPPSSLNGRDPDDPDDPSARFSVSVSCRPCLSSGPESNARAYVRGPDPLSIVLCSNQLRGPEEVSEVLIHELVHAYDVRVRGLDLRDCRDLAYSEVRAAREAECRHLDRAADGLPPPPPPPPPGAKGDNHPSDAGSGGGGEGGIGPAAWMSDLALGVCVRSKAATATRNMFPERGGACVGAVFERAVRDRSPFFPPVVVPPPPPPASYPPPPPPPSARGGDGRADGGSEAKPQPQPRRPRPQPQPWQRPSQPWEGTGSGEYVREYAAAPPTTTNAAAGGTAFRSGAPPQPPSSPDDYGRWDDEGWRPSGR